MAQLGDLAKDEISGFEGIVTGRYEYLYGCVRCTLQPMFLHEGKPIEGQTFDEGQLIVVESRRVRPQNGFVDVAVVTGGPRPNPPTRSTPTR